MVLEVLLSGSQTMDSIEINLFPVQADLKHYETHISFDELEAGDEVTVSVYNDGVLTPHLKYLTKPIEGLQIDPITIINWIPATGYQVSVQQITGLPFKTINWELYTS